MRWINKLKRRWKIGRHELTNTLLHAVVGAAFGLSGFIARTIPSLVIMIPIAMFIGKPSGKHIKPCVVTPKLTPETH